MRRSVTPARGPPLAQNGFSPLAEAPQRGRLRPCAAVFAASLSPAAVLVALGPRWPRHGEAVCACAARRPVGLGDGPAARSSQCPGSAGPCPSPGRLAASCWPGPPGLLRAGGGASPQSSAGGLTRPAGPSSLHLPGAAPQSSPRPPRNFALLSSRSSFQERRLLKRLFSWVMSNKAHVCSSSSLALLGFSSV